MVAKTKKNPASATSSIEWNPEPTKGALSRSEIRKREYDLLYSVGCLGSMSCTDFDKTLIYCKLAQRGLLEIEPASRRFSWEAGPFKVSILHEGRALLDQIASDCTPPGWKQICSELRNLLIEQGPVIELQELRSRLPSASTEYLRDIVDRHPGLTRYWGEKYIAGECIKLLPGWDRKLPPNRPTLRVAKSKSGR